MMLPMTKMTKTTCFLHSSRTCKSRTTAPTPVLLLVVILLAFLVTTTAAAIGPKTTSNTTSSSSYLRRSNRQLEQLDELEDEDGTMVRVIVGFSSRQASTAFAAKVSGGATAANANNAFASSTTTTNTIQGQQVVQLPRANAVAMTISQEDYERLLNEGQEGAVYMEEDFPRVLQQQQQVPQDVKDNEETIPYGIAMIQGEAADQVIPMPNGGGCLNICVIDSGLQVGHPDLPFFNANNVKGISLGLKAASQWNNPNQASGHGTHVVGTMFAKGGNNMGVRGVIPNAQGMCLLVARIFDETGNADMSTVGLAVEWCANNGAHIINMSLGGKDFSQTEAALFQQVWNEGILTVAAAGNAGGTELTFPASYPTVTSVAAVDENFQHASFSQSNAQVNVAAPGVNIISTSTASTVYVIHDQTTQQYEGVVMELSPGITNTGNYRNVPTMNCQKGFNVCTNAGGKVCLMERGTTTFAEKAQNCQQGGGVAAIIYNNATEAFLGTLGDGSGSTVNIPVMSLAGNAGRALLSATSVSFRIVNTGYATLSGTSMATPHVTAVMAKIWAARPRCSHIQIQQAVYESGQDLGPPGRDDQFGHGLVQAVGAYNYLLKTFESPCGDVIATSLGGNTCQANYASCLKHDDCCSGDCRPVTVTSSKCRPPAKLAKTKLGAKNRGGARNRATRHRRHRQRQRALLSSSLGQQPLEKDEQQPEPLQQQQSSSSIPQQQQQVSVSASHSRHRRRRRMIRGGGGGRHSPSVESEFTNGNENDIPSLHDDDDDDDDNNEDYKIDADDDDDTQRKPPPSPTGLVVGVVVSR